MSQICNEAIFALVSVCLGSERSFSFPGWSFGAFLQPHYLSLGLLVPHFISLLSSFDRCPWICAWLFKIFWNCIFLYIVCSRSKPTILVHSLSILHLFYPIYFLSHPRNPRVVLCYPIVSCAKFYKMAVFTLLNVHSPYMTQRLPPFLPNLNLILD